MPALYLATLVKGLRHDSRLATSVSGHDYCSTEIMLARIIDELSFLSWTKSKDAQHNKNRPKSMVKTMLYGDDENETKGFDSPEDFEATRERIIRSALYGN